MRRILLLSIALIGLASSCALEDDCMTAEMGTATVLPAPPGGYPMMFTYTTSMTESGAGYMPSSIVAPISDTYGYVTVTTPGYYSLSLVGGATPPTSSMISLGISADCAGFASSDDVEFNLMDWDGVTPIATCVELMAQDYIIALATEEDLGGDIDITLSYIGGGPVAEDDCAGATLGTSGDINGAGEIFSNNCSSDGTVWIDYTVEEGSSVQIDIAGTGDITTLMDPQIYDVITGDDCSGMVTDVSGTTLTLTCLAVGSHVFIEAGQEALGSAPFEQGDFMITISDLASSVPNELCSDAVSQDTPTCETTELSATDNTTVDACQEAFDFGSCGQFDTAPTVWYAFTTDANAQTVDIELTGTAGHNFVLIDGSAGCPVDNTTLVGCSSSIMDQAVTANTLYYIAVAAADAMSTGTFTLNVTPNYTPTNDDCVDAIDISTGAVDATNFCASADPDGFCSPSDAHTVYFTYTVVAATNVDLQIDITGAGTPLAGTDAAEIALGIFDACGSPLTVQVLDNGTGLPAADNIALCTAIASGPIVLDCIAPSTVITIAAGSADGEDGDFNIGVTEINPAPVNDVCDMADAALGTLPSCELVAMNMVTNMNACPETFMGSAGCDFSGDATAWYTIELPVGAIELEITNISDAGYLGLFSDCGGTQVGDCQTGMGGTIDLGGALAAATTFNLAVAQTDAMGSFTFDLLAVVPPMNDICDPDAELIPVAAPLAIEGTNACATPANFIFCNNDNDHTVYYTYTVDPAITTNRDVTITFLAGGASPLTSASIALFTDCMGNLYNSSIASGDLCDPTAGAIELICVEPMTTLTIAVGSPDMTEGSFTIEITESNPAPDNDACLTPTVVMPDPLPDCIFETIMADNTNACPEAFMGGTGCAFDTDATVWFEIVLPMNATGIEVENFTEVGSYIGLFTDCMTQVGDCLSADGETIEGLAPGTYLVAATQGGAVEGPFEFDIKAIVPPANDDCVDAEPVVDGTPIMSTTNCAGPDFASTDCSLDNTSHTVFFSYENTNAFNIDLTVNIVAGGGVTDTDITSASLLVLQDDCATLYDGNSELCTGLGDNDITCIEAGETVIIMVGSIEGDEGDFTITVTENGDQPADDNDNCTNPFDLTSQLTSCQFVTIIGNTTDACPEDFNVTDGCDFATNPTVWYQVVAPTPGDNITLEITNLAGVDNPHLAVFTDVSDCDNPTPIGNDMAACVTPGGTIFEYGPITAGDTYYIAVGDAMEGAHTFDIKFVTPPANNDCNPDAQDISADAATGVEGTNACASPDDDTDICAVTAMTGHTVYYTYTVSSLKNTILTINVSGSTATTGVAATQVSLGVWLDCLGLNYIDSNPLSMGDECTTIGEDVVFECVEPGTILTIAVASVDMEEGDFLITITEDDTMTPDNDLCSTPEVVTLDDDCVFQTIMGTTVNSCPEIFMGSSCEFDEEGIVWYSVDLPMGGVGFEFDGLDPGLFVGIFNSDNCDNLAIQGNVGSITGITDCITADDQILGLGEGTYLIGVGFENNMPGTFEFDIKSIVPPANDLPCDAEIVDNTMGDAVVTMSGTTDCATFDFEIAGCADEDESSVYYSYTVPAGTNGVKFTLTNTGVGQDFAVGVYGDCAAVPTLFDADVDAICDIGSDEIIFTCLEEGDVLTILVSTEADEAGTFDLIVEPSVPDAMCIDNDDCADAGTASDAGNVISATPNWNTPDTDPDPNDFSCLTDCNLNSCPDMGYLQGACDYGELPTVFYEFTTDGDAGMMATLTAILTGTGTNPIDPMFSIFDACNGTPIAGAECIESNGAGTTATVSGVEMMANTTYIIAVADANITDGIFGGEFELCIKVSTICNDEPCEPYPLDMVGDNLFEALDCNTNIGSSQDFVYSFDGCPEDVSFASVYFSYTGGENVKSAVIRVRGDASNGTPIASTTSVNVFNVSQADCEFSLVEVLVTSECREIDELPLMTIDCPIEDDIYLIMISTEEGSEGDFTLEVTEVLQMEQCTANDDCDTPTELEILEEDICIPQVLVSCNSDACPELFEDDGNCLFGTGAVVWYTFTTPEDVYGGEFSIESIGTNGIQQSFFGVFEEEACPILNPTAVDGAGCVTDPDGIIIDLDGNTTYLIAVGSPIGVEEGDYNLNYTIFAAPPNDDPCLGSDNGPEDITAGGTSGTTCCARGFDPTDPTIDFPNVTPCSNATAEAIVWYVFTPDPDDAGYELTVTATTLENDMTVQIFAGDADTNDGCGGAFTEQDLVGSSCSELSATIRFANCDPNAVYFIKVASAADDCGEFTISVDPTSPNCTATADDCIDAEELNPQTPAECDDGEIPNSIAGCVDLACPEIDPLTNCDHGNGPTVWFQINIDSPDANQLVTDVDAPGFDAVWSMYQGTSCGDMIPVGEPDGPGVFYPCSGDDGDDEDAHVVPIVDNPDTGDPFTYWIAITALGEITDPSFTLTYFSSLGCISCSGDNALDCDNGNFEAFVDGELVELEDFDKFCPGDEVQFCFDFIYDATDTGNDWLHGIIPSFGPGWDLEESDLASSNIGGGFDWFDADGPCAPMLNGYSLPNVCTYMEDGVLKTCHVLCNAPCPCSGPLPDGSLLPSGWFNNSNGGSTTCGTLGCSPASFYGVPSGVFVSVDFCVDLKVKLFEDEECNEENRSLQITIQTTSDAISGCWEDQSPCIIDPSFTGPEWKVNCDSPPTPEADEVFICSGQEAGLEITLPNNADFPITLSLGTPDNSGVDGEGSDPQWGGGSTFMTSSGFVTINDVLVNNTNDIQEVIYTAVVISTDFACPPVEAELSVFVYPELTVEFDPELIEICPDQCLDLSPLVSGGTGNYVDYSWTSGDTGPGASTINVCPGSFGQQQYEVVVTDDAGCQGTGIVTVQIVDDVDFTLGDDITVCQDGFYSDATATIVIPIVNSGDDPVFTWVPEAGLDGTAVGDQFIINEENSFDFDGDGLELCAIGQTSLGCTGEKCVTIFIGSQPEIEVQAEPLECNVTDYQLTNVFANLDEGSPVENLIIRQCGGGTVFFSGNDPSGVFGPFDVIDMNDFDCFEVVAFDDITLCETIEQFTIAPITGDEIVVVGDTVCQGEMATLAITNPASFDTYTWVVSGDATMTSVFDGPAYTFVADSTTTYFVTATGAGCTDDATVTVTVNDPPAVSLAPQFTFCPGGTATAEVSGGVSYLWTDAGGGTVSIADTLTIGVEGMYTVVVTDANGCSSSASTNFVEENQITINILGDNLCDGAETELSIAGDFVDIEWTDDMSNVLASNIDSIFVTSGGTYSVTGRDAQTDCPALGTITIEEFQSPSVVLPELIRVCKDDSGVDSTFVDFASLVTGISGTWQQLQPIPATFLPPYDNVSFEDIASGNYMFVFTTNTATAPCLNVSDTVTVNVRSCPCPSVDLNTPQPICNDGGTINLNGPQVKVTGETGTWTVIAGPPMQNLAGIIVNDSTFTAIGILAGEYTVEFNLSNPGGSNCASSNTTTITVIQVPILSFVDDGRGRICNKAGGSDPTTINLFTLIDTSAAVGAGGVWTDADGNVVNDPMNIDGEDMTVFPDPLPITVTYTYTTMLPNSSPCGDVDITVELTVRNCDCPFFEVVNGMICTSEGELDLNTLLTNDDNLGGNWTSFPVGPVSGSTFDPTGLNSGNYDIIYTLTNDPNPGSNCALADTAILSVISQPELELTPQGPPCNEQTGNGETSVDLFDWIVTDGTQGAWVQTSGIPTLDIDISTAGSAIVEFAGTGVNSTFEFTYTASSVSMPCINPAITVVITVADCMCPEITLDPVGPLCNDGSDVDLSTLIGSSAPGTFSVVRNGSPVTLVGTTLTLNGAQEGSYIITYTLDQMVSGSCRQDTSVTLELENFRDLVLSPETFTVCNNADNGNVATVDLLMFPDNTTNLQAWTDIDGAGVELGNPSIVSFLDLAPGEYRFSVFVDNAEPCPDAIDTVTIIVDPCLCPVIQPGDPEPFCLVGGSNMIDLTQYDDPAQPGTWSSMDFTITDGMMDISTATAGTYTLVYLIDNPSDDPNCAVSVEREIMLLTPSEAGTGNSTDLCISDPQVINLFDLIDGEDTGGSWDPATGLDGMTGDFDTEGLSAGVYMLTYRFLASGECPADEATVTVTVNDVPMVDAGTGFELNCETTSGEIGGPGTSTGAGFSYLWVELENNAVIDDATSAITTVSLPGTYQLTVLNDATGCVDSATVVVTESDAKPSLLVEPSDISCFGAGDGFVSLTDQQGGVQPYTYSFNGGAPVAFEDLILTNLDAGAYTIEIIDNINCSTVYPFDINEPGELTVAIEGAPIIVGQLGGTFNISIEPFDTTGITSIVWTELTPDGTVVASDVTSITVSPPETTTYYVEVMNENGCVANAQVQLQLDLNVDVTFPNVINPKGGSNPVFYINDNDVELVNKLIIYDRWGNKVFSRENFEPNDPALGWDGTYKGQNVRPGVFVFYVEIDFVGDTSANFSGDVTVNF